MIFPGAQGNLSKRWQGDGVKLVFLISLKAFANLGRDSSMANQHG
jgi:hypothetical protein